LLEKKRTVETSKLQVIVERLEKMGLKLQNTQAIVE
jgi:5-enolpyruvylshikimate-3-phosphate synthase